jgi:hypothetical protein
MSTCAWLGFVDDAGVFVLDHRRAFAEWVKKFAETSIPGCRIRRPEEVELDRVYAPEAA